jgi:hypothetical protein
MISMRYAKHLAQGFGLVWNPGETPVEGFTNPLWTLYMAVMHLLPIPLSKTSFFIQLTGALLLVVNVYFVGKITKFLTDNTPLAVGISSVFTMLYFPLNNWGVVLGTEVSVLTTMLTVTTYLALKSNNTIPPLLYPLLGLGILTRMDFVVPAIILILFLIITNRKIALKHALLGIGTLALFIGGQTLFRIYYYHDILPNTYYLKLTGFPSLLRILRGIYVTIKEVPLILLGIAIFPVLMIRRKELILLAALFAGQVLYSMYVGGDAWEFYGGSNRYVTIAMPLLFILFAVSVNLFTKSLKTTVSKQLMTRIVGSLLLIISFISFNAVSDNTPLQGLLLKAPLTTPDNAHNVRTALKIEKMTDDQAVIGVSWAGTIPYFADRKFVDFLGKNHVQIAHQTVKLTCEGGPLRKLLCFWPGHMKWDYAYTLGSLKPDIAMQIYPIDEALPYLKGVYEMDKVTGYWIRKDTKHVHLERL